VKHEWIDELEEFRSLDSIRSTMGLQFRLEKTADFYSVEDVVWFIHKYWNQPKHYLKQRLELVREGQLWVLNIYSAILMAGCLGIWILVLDKLFDNLIKDPNLHLVLPSLMSRDFSGVLGTWSIILWFFCILFIGLVSVFWSRLRRRITTVIRGKFIRGYLNNYDIEALVISKLLEKIETVEKTPKECCR